MPKLPNLILISAAVSLLTAAVPASAQNVTFPMRDGVRPATTNSVPHMQIGVSPVPELSEEMLLLGRDPN